MEQQIRFCTSADGTRIAYSTSGEPAARALVFIPNLESAQEYAWNYPLLRDLYEGYASGRRLVTFDRRGVGSSQREVDDLTIPAQVADLAAIVDELRLESFDLMASSTGGPLAAAYAAEHPERVRRLVLWHPLVRTSDAPILRRIIKAIRADWPMARRGITSAAFPRGPADLQRWFSNTLRDAITAEVYAQSFEVTAEFDGREILPSVQAPTLVLAMPDARDVETSVQAVASLIPDARLVTLEGDWSTQFLEPSHLLGAMRNFLDEAEEETAAPPAPGGFATILFTDMESSTSLRQQLGDERAQELVREHNRIVREALNANSGSEIKHTGDGIMASFSSASRGLSAAVAIQRDIHDYRGAEPESLLRVYIGLNAGEPIAEEGDLFGTSVDLAKRICDQCQPGEILVSDVVRQLAAGKEFLFSDRGETALRGFEDPIKLWELRWQDEA